MKLEEENLKLKNELSTKHVSQGQVAKSLEDNGFQKNNDEVPEKAMETLKVRKLGFYDCFHYVKW